jgi:3-methylcrotonyl-CoA carboxylase alpha subunit
LPAPHAVPAEALVASAARAFLDEREAITATSSSPWEDTGGWRLNQPALRRMEFRDDAGESTVLEALLAKGEAKIAIRGTPHRVTLGPRDGDRLQIGLDDETYFARVARLGARFSATTPAGRYALELVDPFHYEPVDALPDARLTALMPGRVVKVLAAPGEAVKKGQALMILEAMKMEHTITSPRDGVVERVAFAENQLVPADAVLVSFRE